MSEYEQLRDGMTGEAGAAWKQADREEHSLRTLYRELKEDPRYSEAYKSEKAWETYEAAKERIVANKKKARESLGKQAQTAERLSMPLPADESLITTDPAKLLASQNEASRVVRKIERAGERGGPFKPKPGEVLKQEYRRGLEVGGMQGGAICRGVLMAADELGIDADSIVDEFREERHRKALESARHCERAGDLIGTRLSEPPFPRPGSVKARLADRGPAPLFIPRSQAQTAVKEPAHVDTKRTRRAKSA